MLRRLVLFPRCRTSSCGFSMWLLQPCASGGREGGRASQRPGWQWAWCHCGWVSHQDLTIYAPDSLLRMTLLTDTSYLVPKALRSSG